MQKKRIFTNFGTGILSEIVNKVFPLLIISIATNRLGVEGFGTAQFVIYLFEVTVPFIVWGYGSFASIEVGKLNLTDSRIGTYVKSIALLRLFHSVLIFAGLVVLVTFVDHYRPYQTIVLTISFVYLTSALDASYILLATHRLSLFNTINMVAKALSLGGVFWLVQSPADVHTYVLITVLSNAFVALAILASVIKHIKGVKIDLSQVKSVFRKSLPFSSMIIVVAIWEKMDVFIVEYFLDLTSVGQFAGVLRLFSSISPILGLVVSVFYSEMLREKDQQKFYALTRFCFWGVSTVVWPTIFGSFFVGEGLIDLILGSQFTAVAHLFPILVVSLFASMFILVCGNVIMISGQVSLLNKIFIGGVCLSLCLSLVGINIWGLPGVALAYTTGKLTTAALIVTCYLKLKNPFPTQEILRPMAAGLMMALVLVIAQQSNLFINLAIGAAAYGLFFLVFNFSLIQARRKKSS